MMGQQDQETIGMNFNNYKKIKTPIKGMGNYTLWVADTPLKKIRGLKNIRSLPNKCGMIFVYDKPVKNNFTMAGVKIPLTIMFLDKNFNILNVVKAKPGEKSIFPNCEYQYVIEI